MLKLVEYKIDFNVLEVGFNEKTIIIYDQSEYIEEPESPTIEVILPGFKKGYRQLYEPGKVNVINTASLGVNKCPTILNDGVYWIKLSICPHDELFARKPYLRNLHQEIKYMNTLLKLDASPCNLKTNKELQESLVEVDVMIQASKASAQACNITNAVNFYNEADKLLEKINKKLNGCK